MRDYDDMKTAKKWDYEDVNLSDYLTRHGLSWAWAQSQNFICERIPHWRGHTDFRVIKCRYFTKELTEWCDQCCNKGWMWLNPPYCSRIRFYDETDAIAFIMRFE